MQQRELHRRFHDVRGRAQGTVVGAALSSTGAVSGISGAWAAKLRRRNPGSTLTINNTANAGNFTTVGDVSMGTLTALGAATATGALTGATTLTITGAASAGPLDCESLDWVLDGPESRREVGDDLDGPKHQRIPLVEPAGPCGERLGVFGANG